MFVFVFVCVCLCVCLCVCVCDSPARLCVFSWKTLVVYMACSRCLKNARYRGADVDTQSLPPGFLYNGKV